jgi:hypothetical protein
VHACIQCIQSATLPIRPTQNLSCNLYCTLQDRLNDPGGSWLLSLRDVLQEFLVTVFAKIERNRLEYYARNQHLWRTELVSGLQDALYDSDLSHQFSNHPAEDGEDTGLAAEDVGRPFILPATFTAGPRYMKACYWDAMAFLPSFKHPDLFITFTANPKCAIHC